MMAVHLSYHLKDNNLSYYVALIQWIKSHNILGYDLMLYNTLMGTL